MGNGDPKPLGLGVGNGGRGTSHRHPAKPFSHCSGTTAGPRSLRARRPVPVPAARRCPFRDGWVLCGVGRVLSRLSSRFFGSRNRATARFSLSPASKIHVSSPRAEVSSSKNQSKNNLQDLGCCYWYLSFSLLQTSETTIFPKKKGRI